MNSPSSATCPCGHIFTQTQPAVDGGRCPRCGRVATRDSKTAPTMAPHSIASLGGSPVPAPSSSAPTRAGTTRVPSAGPGTAAGGAEEESRIQDIVPVIPKTKVPRAVSVRGPRPVAPAGPRPRNERMLFASEPPHYVLEREIATGGAGILHAARDVAAAREVVIKQIRPEMVDDLRPQARLETEARLTAQLEHPCIVPVYAIGTDEWGRPYYVMRLVRGRTLDEIIGDYHKYPNPLVFRELIRRLIAVAQAVAFAHSRGVIHRDLKPANIILGDYGETFVLDWGLARAGARGAREDGRLRTSGANGAGGSPDGGAVGAGGAGAGGLAGAGMAGAGALNTQLGQIVGTPGYMAPEQLEGRVDLHSPLTDIYGLGCILYKILTGSPPPSPEIARGRDNKVRFTYVPPPAPSWHKGVHPTLEGFCLRATRREPAERYQRAGELAQDLQRFLDEVPLSFAPRNLKSRVLPWLQQNGWWLTAALLALNLVALLGWWLMRV